MKREDENIDGDEQKGKKEMEMNRGKKKEMGHLWTEEIRR